MTVEKQNVKNKHFVEEKHKETTIWNKYLDRSLKTESVQTNFLFVLAIFSRRAFSCISNMHTYRARIDVEISTENQRGIC